MESIRDTKGLVIGCGKNCQDPIEYGQGKWIKENDGSNTYTPFKKSISHNEIHQQEQYLTLDLSDQYNPDIVADIQNRNLISQLNGKKFSQIIIEHLPPVSINRQTIHNLSELLQQNGICVVALSRYLGSGIGSVGKEYLSGRIEKIATLTKLTIQKYKPGDYEFFNHLKEAGFKTILVFDNEGLNYILFKEDLDQAKKTYIQAKNNLDYLGKILNNNILLTKPFDMMWCSVDNAFLLTQRAFRALIQSQYNQIQQKLKLNSNMEVEEFVNSVMKNDKTINVVHGIGLLTPYIDKELINKFIEDYNDIFTTEIRLHKKNLEQIKNSFKDQYTFIFFIIETKESKQKFILKLEEAIPNDQIIYFPTIIRRAAFENPQEFLDAIKGTSEIKKELIAIMGNQEFSELENGILKIQETYKHC